MDLDRSTEIGPRCGRQERGSRTRSAEDNGETAKPDQQGTGLDENQECRILDDRSGEKQTRGEREEGNERSRWPEEKTREDPPCLTNQHKIEETDGGAEGTKVTIDEGTERIEWSAAENSGGQAGQLGEEGVPRSGATLLKDAEDTKPEGTDSGVGKNVC